MIELKRLFVFCRNPLLLLIGLLIILLFELLLLLFKKLKLFIFELLKLFLFELLFTFIGLSFMRLFFVSKGFWILLKSDFFIGDICTPLIVVIKSEVFFLLL